MAEKPNKKFPTPQAKEATISPYIAQYTPANLLGPFPAAPLGLEQILQSVPAAPTQPAQAPVPYTSALNEVASLPFIPHASFAQRPDPTRLPVQPVQPVQAPMTYPPLQEALVPTSSPKPAQIDLTVPGSNDGLPNPPVSYLPPPQLSNKLVDLRGGPAINPEVIAAPAVPVTPSPVHSAAPQSPEEEAQRLSKWEQMFTSLQQNPNVMMALMRAGAELMQPMPMWQSSAGHVGRALNAGVDYLQASQKADIDRKVAEQGIVESKARVAQTGAATAKTEAETANVPKQGALIDAQVGKILGETKDGEEMRPLVKKKLIAEYNRLQSQNLLDEGQFQMIQAQIQETQELTPAKREYFQAMAQYYRSGGRGAAGSGSDPAAMKIYQHYVDWKTQDYIKQGMKPEEALQKAQGEGMERFLTGASGQKNWYADLATKDTIESDWEDWQALDEGKKKKFGTFKEFVRIQHGEDADLTKNALVAAAGKFVKAQGDAQVQQGKQAPPAGAIEKLKKNPGLAKDFDAKYGQGSAQKYLGK